MALIKKYKDRLVEPLPNSYGYGYVNLNEDIKDMLLEDIFECSFNCLYARLLVHMYNDGLLDKLNIKKDIIDKVDYFVQNRSRLKNNVGEYQDYKVWINSLYNSELKPYATYLINLYGQYMTMYFEDIVKQNQYNWLYIDTDVMYFTGSTSGIGTNSMHPDINRLFENEPISISIEHIDYITFFGKKRYVKHSKGDIKTKGVRAKDQQGVINIIKTKIRERKIDEVLDESL